MRVKREGDLWTQSYSTDGVSFTETVSFTYALTTTAIGPYAGNASGNPAHTAKIDYFVNLADPITDEDGCTVQQPPILASIGNQSVEEGNNLPLTLTATDADGNDIDIDFTETGLPSFAVLTDNNDGTASLDINPQTGDEGTYTVTIVVTDLDNLTDEETFDIVVTSTNTIISNLVSDDFCASALNTIWTFIDPIGDGTLALTNPGTNDAFLEISVPAGLEHQLWKVNGIKAPHIIQASNDTDFELEVKMESPVNAPQYQQQGIIVKQDDYNFLRFEISSDNTMTKALAAVLHGTNTFPLTSSIPVNINIGNLNTAPIYMRVKREGDLWTQSYSFDGTTWFVAGSFTHAIAVSGVGLYSGNAIGTSSPAHTAKFDYFKNLEDPIIDEDSCVLCTGGLIATWNGSVSSDWEDPNNWTPNVVPTACSEITIPATANTPSLMSHTTVKDLTINSGSNVLVPLDTNLSIGGDLTMYSSADTFSGLVVNGNIAVSGYH